MVAAAAVLRKDIAVARPEALLSRAEVLTRYRHLRGISKQHHSTVLDFLSKDTIISQARRLGLAQGKTLVLDSMDDLYLAFDLAIYTAPKERSRAIDRYARAALLAPESDESLVLEAMRRARFSIITIVRRHPAAGLLVRTCSAASRFGWSMRVLKARSRTGRRWPLGSILLRALP